MVVSSDNRLRNDSVSALLIGAYNDDRLLLHDIFHARGWRLFEAPGRRHAMQCLERNAIEVVIAESGIPNWTWKRILHDLRSLPVQPQLIVTSRMADDSLWAEVLNCGGYDVLAQPFVRDEVERVIGAARRHFDRKPAQGEKSVSLSVGAA